MTNPKPTYDELLARVAQLEQQLLQGRGQSAALAGSLPWLDDLVNVVGHPVFVKDADHRWVFLNDAYCEFMGHPREELMSKSDYDFFPESEADVFWAKDEAVLQTNLANVNEELFTDAKGQTRTILTQKTPFTDPRGNRFIVGVITDVTARAQAEEALRQSQGQLRAVLDATPFPVAVVDLQDDRIQYWSRSALTIFGHTAPTAAEWYELAYPDPDYRREAVAQWRPFLEVARASKQAVRAGEYRICCRDGSVRICEIHAACLPDFLVVTFNDVTERRRAEDERAKLEVQLRQALKMESVGRLAGGVAHDFNNMLAVILGNVGMALEELDPAHPLRMELTEISVAAERSADLTRQLLAFARKQTIAPKVLDLNETVGSMLKMLQRLIGEDVQLVWLPQAGLWPVKVDPSQIDQILANLCVNARDAITDVGRISIETGNSTFDEDYCRSHAGLVPGEFVRLAVSDDGCGMDQATLGNIFEPFFTTKEMGRGTGLGLATVYGIVKQNDGFINVASEPGAGTTLTIYLARYGARSSQTRSSLPAGPVAGGHETILLVEDEAAILKMTSKMLERQGYTVLAAATPGEAMRLATEHSGEIDLLMTDVVMPEMNGRELARNVLAIHPAIARLFMSGHTADVIAHHGVLSDGVHFIQKPFSAPKLAAKVREALGKG